MATKAMTTVTRSATNFAAKRTMSRMTGFDLAPAVTSKEWGVKMVPARDASTGKLNSKPLKRTVK